MDKDTLPPLPIPGESLSKWAYDASDMHAYARQAIAEHEANRVPEGFMTMFENSVAALSKEVDAGWSPDAQMHARKLEAAVCMMRAAMLSAKPTEPAATLPKLENCGRYLAQDNTGQWHYINHAGTWQACPPHLATESAEQPPDATPEEWKNAAWKVWKLARTHNNTIPSHWLDAMRDAAISLCAPPQPVTQARDERAAFEAWAKDAGWPHAWRYCNTDGRGFSTDSWLAWQARAALSHKQGQS